MDVCARDCGDLPLSPFHDVDFAVREVDGNTRPDSCLIVNIAAGSIYHRDTVTENCLVFVAVRQGYNRRNPHSNRWSSSAERSLLRNHSTSRVFLK